MILDVFTFNGEYDLLEIRLNILDNYVDQFIIVEAPTTFTGKPKPLYYEQGKERYKQWEHKIKYFVIDENYTDEERKLAEESPNTKGAEHWKHEFLQKESIKKALVGYDPLETICYIGDVDEIWNPKHPEYDLTECWKLKLKVYTYYLNNRSDEIFNGSLYGKLENIKDECLNHLRSSARKTLRDCGWHFTSMGGYDEVYRKLSSSYTDQSYWTDTVRAFLKRNIEECYDFLGRDFTYTIDESDLPTYLLYNKEKYGHLFRKDR